MTILEKSLTILLLSLFLYKIADKTKRFLTGGLPAASCQKPTTINHYSFTTPCSNCLHDDLVHLLELELDLRIAELDDALQGFFEDDDAHAFVGADLVGDAGVVDGDDLVDLSFCCFIQSKQFTHGLLPV